MRILLRLAVLTCLLAANVGARAQANTALAQLGYYADPEIHVFDGQYWIYPTSSNPASDQNQGLTYNALQRELRTHQVVQPVYLLQTSMDAFSSPDLVHWTRHPGILDVKNVPWAAYALWAPSVIHQNGKYYLGSRQKTDNGVR